MCAFILYDSGLIWVQNYVSNFPKMLSFLSWIHVIRYPFWVNLWCSWRKWSKYTYSLHPACCFFSVTPECFVGFWWKLSLFHQNISETIWSQNYQTPFAHVQITHLEIHTEFTGQTLSVKSTAYPQGCRYDMKLKLMSWINEWMKIFNVE